MNDRFTNSRPLDEGRLRSLDIARGVVMVLMAVDHVRVYASAEALGGLGQMSASLFVMRWVTHFCAPAFVFLAGVGAALRRSESKGELARYLAVRGVWLILLEFTVVRVAWTFSLAHYPYFLGGVIWAIGVSLVVLALLVRLPRAALIVFGLVVVAGHDAFDAQRQALAASLQDDRFAWFWQLLWFGGDVELGATGAQLAVLYSIVPWVGVMALGYAFGPVMKLEPARRRRICFALGGAALAAFLVLRGFNVYGNPWPWTSSPRGAWFTAFSFVNTDKYPASLQFVLMTLGPLLVALPWFERARGATSEILATFGRVPLLFYLLHIPLIHGLAIALAFARTGSIDPWFFANHPAAAPPTPDGLGYGVAAMVALTAFAVALLYLPSRAYATWKRSDPRPWMRLL
ncbi:MAG: heparan-alpha-glucosaminide N-acetyltransferase domain-containing protein [Planctomycetes bacterium]|nr:heparan-alpha-glucosaminide N-acetyltransferase domain-containing protein [Planctomycetota bacterium]